MTKLNISDPVLVAMGPPSLTSGWGSYQFPSINRSDDGVLVVTFSDCADCETAYGSEPGCMVSSDGGKSWTKDRLRNYPHLGVKLPNGERVSFPGRPSIPLEGLKLPEPIGVSHLKNTIYAMNQVSKETVEHTWILRRSTPDNPNGTDEEVTLDWKDMMIRSCFDVLVRPWPRGRLRLAPNGTLWMPHYYMAGIEPETKRFIPYLCNYLFKSTDNGHTWEQVNFLPFYPEHEGHPDAEKFEGYGENDITVTPDGSLIRLIRTGSNFPCLYTRSSDGGKTWSKPTEFDDHGVWPCLLTLKCGVTLATYGRPGVWLRATSDPSAAEWDSPIELVHSDGFKEPSRESVLVRATCGYTNLIALDDRTAGLIYSDFRVQDHDGNPRKCIMYRTITVES